MSLLLYLVFAEVVPKYHFVIFAIRKEIVFPVCIILIVLLVISRVSESFVTIDKLLSCFPIFITSYLLMAYCIGWIFQNKINS